MTSVTYQEEQYGSMKSDDVEIVPLNETKTVEPIKEVRSIEIPIRVEEVTQTTTEEIPVRVQSEIIIQEIPKLAVLEAKPFQIEETRSQVLTSPALVAREDKEITSNEPEPDWQYQLPSPPKAFQDSTSPPENAESVVDSVVTSPELFEKLKAVKDNQSEPPVEEDKPILNKLSLENLEKRKSLVYNRELATSLKMPNNDEEKETYQSSLSKFEKTFDEIKRSSPNNRSTLPNFKITTYDNPKQKKFDIFEDDTIRSNHQGGSKRNSLTEKKELEKSSTGRSMENISSPQYSFFKPQYNSVFRSESFSQSSWTPVKPVTRSKSQAALHRNARNLQQQTQDDQLSKSNSLFDVSGLQSLGVSCFKLLVLKLTVSLRLCV